MLDGARLTRSFAAAFAGLQHVFHSQPNWRIHLSLTGLALALGLALGLTPIEWAILAATAGLVLSLEAMNTAIEAAVDAIPIERTLNTRHAKDAAAGAVLVASLAALGVGAALFVPRLLALIR